MMNDTKKTTLKEKLFAHVETTRPYTFIWCGLVSLVGACLAFNDLPPLRTTVLVLVIPMMGWIAGLYLSDFLDRKLDMIQKPHRPIPSGRIKPEEAIITGAVLAFSGFFLSFLLGFLNVLLVFPVAVLVASYAKFTKSRGILGNLNRGFVIVVAYFFGVVSVQKDLSLLTPSTLLLSLAFLVHDTNSNLIGAIRDMWGDKQGGYITVPVKHGIKGSMMISLSLSIIYISIIIIPIGFYQFIPHLDRFSVMFFIVVLILFFMYGSIFFSKKEIDRERALKAHEFLIAERITLASAFLFGIISDIISSLTIFIVGISVSLVSQYMLRRRYEFKE